MWKDSYIKLTLLVLTLTLLVLLSTSCRDKDVAYAYSMDKNGILNKNVSELYRYLYDKSKTITKDDEYIEGNFCELHDQLMKKESIEILYGLIKHEEKEIEPNLKYTILKMEYFYNCNDPTFGGGVMSQPYFEDRYVCDECNRISGIYKKMLGIKY